MVFQWFPMVANHWSSDGMVTIHRLFLINRNKVFGERKLIESLSLEGLSIGIGRLKGPPVGLTLTTPPIECQFFILFILFLSVKG